MLYELDFVVYIRSMTMPDQQKDRRVMARVALNALYDSEVYPVDLSEVMKMHSVNRTLARAFVLGCSLRPEIFLSWPEAHCAALIKIAAMNLEELPA